MRLHKVFLGRQHAQKCLLLAPVVCRNVHAKKFSHAPRKIRRHKCTRGNQQPPRAGAMQRFHHLLAHGRQELVTAAGTQNEHLERHTRGRRPCWEEGEGAKKTAEAPHMVNGELKKDQQHREKCEIGDKKVATGRQRMVRRRPVAQKKCAVNQEVKRRPHVRGPPPCGHQVAHVRDHGKKGRTGHAGPNFQNGDVESSQVKAQSAAAISAAAPCARLRW
jgi:hypothetical protein